MSVLLSLHKIANVRRFVWKGLFALAMVLLVEPRTFVECSIWIAANALTIKLVFRPEALVHGAIRLDVSALAFPPPLTPIAEVVGQVWCLAEAKAVLL